MRTREMAAIERDELLGIEASVRPPITRRQRRRPTARTQRLRASMIALVRPELPTTAAGRIAVLASAIIAVVVVLLALR